MIRPKIGEDTSDKVVDKGTLQKTYDYLKTSDPTSYYYNKLKDSNNPFLNDKMWAEATRRGESDILATILENRMQYETGKEYTGGDQESAGANSIQQLDKEGIDAFSRWQSYQDLADYDSYMLALEIPMLDNSEKKDRIAENGYNFGQYTDREWALEILNSQFQKIDAQIVESNKNVWTFFSSIGVAIAAAPTKVLGGISRFLQDVFDTGEGLLNLLFNWSQDDPEQRFLWAFSNDEGQLLNELADELTYCTYDIERRFTGFVDANLAYEQGYVAGTNIGRGAGYTSIGQMYQGVMDSIGYMIPSMLTNVLIPGSGTAVFYAGMAAGEIKDQVETAALNGISYKDLNAGEVIANATLKAAAQAVIEIALDKILGLTQIDRLRGVKGKVVSKLPDVTAKGWKAAGQVLMRMGKEALQEGLEEVLQDMSDGFIDMCFGKITNQDEIYQRGLDKYNIGDLMNSFIAGALTSIVIGSIANLKYIPQSQRGVGINEAGEAYTFGFFQTLNYAEALRTMNEWNNTLNDENASLEDKMSTAIKMNSTLNLLGSLFSSMGIENSTKANELLNRFADKQARESVLKTRDGKTSAYWSIANTTKAFEKFMSNNKTLVEAYIPKSLGDKIKETFSKLASKKNLPTNTEVESITTTDMKAGDEKIEMSNEALETLKKVANNVGAKVIIGTNNAIITRDGDIAIVSQKIIDVINAKDAHAEIVRGLAYDKAISAISDNLLDGQKQFILDTYIKVTGDNTATLEIAIDALLFDRSFYTELLLLSGERNAKASVDLLVKINEIVKKELSKLDSRVDSQAAKVLLQKIVSNMRSGFTMYATKYADVNIDEISDEVLPKDLKDTIRNHQNVIFTRSVLRAIAKAKSKVQYNNKELAYLDKMIDAFAQYLTPEIVAQLKRDIRGSSETAKLQALGIIQYCSKLDNSYGSNKVIILPSVNNGNQVKAEQYTKELCDLFGGVSLDQIANGDYDVNKLSDTVVSFVSQTNEDGLQMYSLGTKQDRLEVARALIFELSKGMFTINANFNLCQVISRNEFLKTEYLDDAKLLNDIKEGKVKTIKDIVKAKNIDKNLLAISIVLSNTRNSSYTDGNNYISISRFAKSAGASIMHELTHVSQYLIMASNPDSVITTGGSAALFKGLQKDVEQDLEKYILDNFPILYNLLKKTNNKNTYQDVIYYLLEGELEANVSISGLLPATGFTLKNKYTVLASPNNKKTWSLKVGSVEQRIFEIAKEQVSEKADVKTEPEQMDDLQYGILDKTLNKSRPTNDAYITVQNTYEVEPNEALKYVMKVTGKNVEGNDFSELIKAAEEITLDKKLSKDSVKLFRAGLDYAKRLQQYYQDIANWLEKVKAVRAKQETKKHTSKDIPLNLYTEDQKATSEEFLYTGDIVNPDITSETAKSINNNFKELTPNAKVELLNRHISEDVELTPYEETGLELLKNIDIYMLNGQDSLRLMGVKSEDASKLNDILNDRLQKHLAGDSIVVNVLQAIFEKLRDTNILTNPIKLIEFFAGYGSQHLALNYSGFNVVDSKIAEWAIPSILAYSALHNTDTTDYSKSLTKEQIVDFLLNKGVSINYNNPASINSLKTISEKKLRDTYNAIQRSKNLVDITKVTGKALEISETDIYDYILTYSFPCQDLSRAGLRKGMAYSAIDKLSTKKQLSIFDDEVKEALETEERTRSSMIWEVGRILKECSKTGNGMPKVLLMENVPQIVDKKNMPEFQKWIDLLNELGYTSAYSILRADQFGIPQKRERAFLISIYQGTNAPTFPIGKPTNRKVSDFIDKTVEHTKLSENGKRRFMGHNKLYTSNVNHNPINQNIAATLTTSQYSRAEGGNFRSDQIDDNIDLISLLHPKTEEDLKLTKLAIEKVKRGEKLIAKDARRQISMFDSKSEADRHISEDREIIHRSSKDTIYNFNKELGKTRQPNLKRALQSNLKYFIPKEKGLTLQMHPGLADFIEATTADENKLSDNIRNLIHQGKLDKSDLKDLVAFGKANEYELQMIAKYVFRNELIAKMSRKEFNALLRNIEDISIAAYLISNAEGNLEEEYSAEEMLALKNELSKEYSTEELSKASYQSITTLVKDENGKLKPTEVILDPTQLVLPFLRYYDGTLNGILTINKYAKKLAAMQSTDIVTSRINDIGEISNWNWASLMTRAENIYDEELDDTLNELTDEDKRTAIKQYLQDNLIAKLGNKTYTAAQQLKIATELQQRLDYIDTLEGEKLNKIYFGTIQQETSGQKSGKQAIEGIDTVDIKEQLGKRPTSEKSSTDRIRILANNIATKIGKSKTAYNNLPDDLKSLFVTGKYNKYEYVGAQALKDMSKENKEALIPVLQEAYSKLKERADIKRAQARAKEKEAERLAKMTERMNAKQTNTRTTFREKIEIIHKTKIVNQTFVVESPMELTYNTDPAIPASGNLIEELLNTTWDKYKVSEVQGVESNENTFVANYNKFLKDNAVNILSADVNTIAEVCKWFLNTRLSMNATDEDVDQFNVIKQFILETVNTMSKGDGLYSALDQDFKNKIDKWVQRNASASGRSNAIHGAILKAGDPLATLRSEEMNIDGVVIPDELKDKVYDAINSMDIPKINEAIREAQAYASKNKTAKKSFLHKIQTTRQLSMLSGPLTWLRNKVSNIVLKRLNKVASAIGNRVFKGKTSTALKQIKLANTASTEAKNYIQKNFVDTGYFDKLVTSLSKYNPSSVRQKNGVKTKEEIMASLVIKTLYNEYYNEHNFDSKFMNKAFQWIMARMSDDAYVREAAIRYFGRIITEKGYDLSQDGITDEIMNDFSNALGLAMSDYMHSDNFFNVLERAIAEKSEAGWFVYKTILPFASASWNWFKAMTKLTPFGLAKSIVDMHYLEKRVAKQQALWMAGKTQINPELTEYMIRRDIGTGVIGTIGFGVGILLAALGFIRLDDDDYGNPKLRIGNLTIDISSIFGASSILAGGALITGIRDEHSFNAALNRMLDVTLDNFPIMDILQLDMYSNGAWDVMQSTAESLATSYIPNLISYFAGATYTGKLKKDTFWKRAIAKIPFLGNFLDKQVNPYTGDTGSYIDAINRIVPYFSYEAASLNESKTNELGLNKSQLRGKYTINDKDFSISGNDLQKLNENYGKWNATDLTKFYSNKLKVRVKVGGGYQTLSYNQMTDAQRKSAVQNIMSNNANLAKIYAWTSQGNKYYASEDTYNKLRTKGITKNVYVGTKGFVEK